MAIADYPSEEAAAQAGDPEALAKIAAFVNSVTPIDDIVRRLYPQMAWVLANPELAPLLRQAASERWDPARLLGALQATTWWQTTDANQREWQRLAAEDPNTAFNTWFQNLGDVTSQMRQLGVTLADADIRRIADMMSAEHWDAQRVQYEIMRYATGLASDSGGQLRGTMDSLQAKAAEFFMPLGDDAAFQWAKNIGSGFATDDGFTAYLRDQAITRFAGDSTIVTALQQGATVAQIFDPLRQQTAALLEMAPDQINLMDPKWSNVLDGVQDDGTRRPMSLSEAATYVRGLDEWKGTAMAGQQSADLGETLLKTFGAVA